MPPSAVGGPEPTGPVAVACSPVVKRRVAIFLALAAVAVLLTLGVPRERTAPAPAEAPGARAPGAPDAIRGAAARAPAGGASPGPSPARAPVAPDASRAEHELLVEALVGLALEREDGSRVARRDLVRVAELLLERRGLAFSGEPPAIARDVRLRVDEEVRRLAGIPPGELVARLPSPPGLAPRHPQPAEAASP